MAQLTIVFWRDIPAQVIVKAGRQNAKRQLSERFEKAIDRAAMRAGRGSSDAYLADWRRESEMVEGDIEALVNDKVLELEAGFPEDYLEKVVKNGGLIEGVSKA